MWRRRDFRLLLIDRFLAPAALSFSLVGVSFAVLALTGSVADLSYVLAAQVIPAMLVTPISGAVADRIRPQYVIAASCVLSGLCEGALAVLVLTRHAHMWQIVALQAGSGAAQAIFYPAAQALLPRLVPDEELQAANAVSRLVMNGAMVAGSALGGFVVAAYGPGWALAGDAVAVLLATVPNLLIRAAGNAPASEPSLFQELRGGWDEFRSHRWLWVIVLEYAFILMATYCGYNVLGPVVANSHLGGAAAWGEILAAETVGLVAGGLAAMRYTPKRPMLFVALSGAMLAAPTLALGLVLPLWLICVVSFATGISLELMLVQWNLVMARNIPPDKLGRVSAYDILGSFIATPLGALVAGPLAVAFGVRATQLGVVVAVLLASTLVLAVRDIRARPAPAEVVDLVPEPAT